MAGLSNDDVKRVNVKSGAALLWFLLEINFIGNMGIVRILEFKKLGTVFIAIEKLAI